MTFQHRDGFALTVNSRGAAAQSWPKIGRRALLSRWHMKAGVQLADILGIIVLLVFAVVAFPIASEVNPIQVDRWITEACVVGMALFLAFHMVGAYNYDLISKPARSSLSVICPCIAISGPFMLMNAGRIAGDSQIGLSFIGWSVAVICVLGGIRLLAAQMHKRLSDAGLLAHTICIIGDGAEARACIRLLQSNPGNSVLLGYFVADGRPARTAANLPFLGHVEQIATFLCRERVDEVIVATPADDRDGLSDLISDLRCLPVVLSIWPETINLPALGTSARGGRTGSIPLLPLGAAPLSGWAWVAKEVQDRTIAAVLLLACLPVLLIISVSIRICSPGPALFRQMRQGYCGREFRILKFRTMHVASSDPLDKLVLTTKKDHRTFPLGALLRRSSLDELPQLLNVLRGDMWLIGPRPHSPLATVADRFYADAVARYAARHKIKPGITGWAQINGWRGPTSTIEQIEQRVAHDLYYIDNWSPLLDIRILLMTALRGFVHRNAF